MRSGRARSNVPLNGCMMGWCRRDSRYPTVQRFVKAWHEEANEAGEPVAAKSGTEPLTLRIDVSASPSTPHKNKYGKDYKPQAGETEDERY